MKNLFLFPNTRAVIRADALATEAEIRVQVVPVPLTLSSQCGMCLLVDEPSIPQIESLLQAHQIPYTLYHDPASTHRPA